MIPLALAAALTCFSPKITDGDTIKDCAGQHVRLFGLDAPETSRSPRCHRANASTNWACDPAAMRWAIPAKQRLEDLTRGKAVTCEPTGVDRYRRTVAVCRADGVDVGQALVREGLARAYVQYSTRYLADETRARREHRGMWSEVGR